MVEERGEGRRKGARKREIVGLGRRPQHVNVQEDPTERVGHVFAASGVVGAITTAERDSLDNI